MNKVEIIGRLTKDPEVRYTASTQMAVANFTVAVDDGFGEKKRTNFIPVVVFGKTAESCEKFTGKGLRIAVEGKIQTGSYEDKEGIQASQSSCRYPHFYIRRPFYQNPLCQR